MNKSIMLTILIIAITACSPEQNELPPLVQNDPTNTVSGTAELVLSDQDLLQLGIAIDGTDCRTEEYSTDEYSPLVQYSFCQYTIDGLNDTEIVIELKKFATLEVLNGTYQYDSSHLFSVQGLISENEFGDASRFRVNNVNDYGGQFNDPNISYYHLWISKNEYLIHITSKGSREAKEPIANIGKQILSKFQ